MLNVMARLKDQPAFQFDQLMDIAGVDYLEYGKTEWKPARPALRDSAAAFQKILLAALPLTITPLKIPAGRGVLRWSTIYCRCAITSACALKYSVMTMTINFHPSSRFVNCGIRPTGMSVKRLIYTASCLRAIPICAAC